MTRKKYQVFTPKSTVDDMLDYIKYSGPSIIRKRIIDLSCGDGAFLCAILERLITECKKQHFSEEKILRICKKNIYGIEIDEKCYIKCLTNLNKIINKEFNKKYIKWTNIACDDGLEFKNASFDFVVGNPPYISYRDMTKEKREYLKVKFESCKSNRFDYSYAFVEKSLSILSENGKGCIICPINMYKIKSGELIKRIIRPYLSAIIDVTEDNIFPNVLTNPVISIFDKKKKSGPIVIIKKNAKIRKLDRNNFEDKIMPIPSLGKRRFGDFFEVHNGVATLFNQAFIVEKAADIEQELLKNACSPRFMRQKMSKNIIFPYELQCGQITRMSEERFEKEYPKAYNHLLQYKDELNKRKVSVGAKWFEYGRTQALNSVGVIKIMMPAIMSKGVKPVLLEKNDVIFAGLYVIEKDPKKHPIKEAFDILSNNKSLYNYIKNSGVKMNGGSYRYGPYILENYKY